MRKHVGWYLKGMPRSTDSKNRINTETDSRKVLESLAEYGFWLAGQ
jgi:tRNA-dihydrouridine synthase